MCVKAIILRSSYDVDNLAVQMVKSQFSESAATGDRVLAAGIVYLAVVFAGGYLLRVLTRNLTAGMDRPGESAEQVKNAGM